MQLSKALELPAETVEKIRIWCHMEPWERGITQFVNLKELNLDWSEKKDLPEGISTFKKLEKLIIHNSKLTALPEWLKELPNLKTLEILGSKGRNKGIQKLPTWIGDLQSLEKLSITKGTIKSLPKSITKLTNLKYLILDWHQIKELPTHLFDLPKLKQLNLSRNRFKILPKEIGNLKRLTHLYLTRNRIEEIPLELYDLDKITVLDLSDNYIRKVTDDIEKLPKLQRFFIGKNPLKELSDKLATLSRLKILDLDRTHLEELPKVIGEINTLEQLYIGSNEFKMLPLELGKLTNLKKLNWDKILQPDFRAIGLMLYKSANIDIAQYRKENRKLARIMEAARLVKLSDEEVLAVVSLWSNKTEEIREISRRTLLRISQLKQVDDVPDLATETLWKQDENALKDKPLSKGSSLTIIGNVSLEKSEIKPQLDDLEITYSAHPITTTTHVVLGPNSSLEDYLDLLNSDKIVLIKEEDLQAYLYEATQPYLLEKSEEQDEHVEKVRQLLESADNDNIALAFQLMKSGGVPKSLMTELLIVYKYTGNKKNSKQARELLKLHGSKILQHAMQKKFRKLSTDSTDNLYIFTEGTEIKQWKINQYVYLNVKYWTNGMAMNNLIGDAVEQAPEQEREVFIEQLFKKWTSDYNGRILWDHTLNFEKYGARIYDKPEIKGLHMFIPYWYKSQIQKFPKGIARMKDRIVELTLHLDMSYMGGIPMEFFELTNLKVLTFQNAKLTDIPKEIGNLTELEELSFYKNELSFIPKEILQLKKLKKLDLQYAFKDGVEHDLTPLREALPNCNVVL